MNHQKILREVFDCSKTLAPVYGVRIACAIYKNNRFVSFGRNSIKSDPFHARFSKGFKIYLHAETGAIKNAIKALGNVKDLENCTLYIARAKFVDSSRKKMIQGLAKPCEGCQRAIAEFGISEVVFTKDGEGFDIL